MGGSCLIDQRERGARGNRARKWRGRCTEPAIVDAAHTNETTTTIGSRTEVLGLVVIIERRREPAVVAAHATRITSPLKMSPRPPPASHEPSQHTSLRSRFSGRAAAVEPAIDCSEARDIQEFRARVFVIRARKVGERSVRPNRHARKHV